MIILVLFALGPEPPLSPGAEAACQRMEARKRARDDREARSMALLFVTETGLPAIGPRFDRFVQRELANKMRRQAR